MTDKQFQDVLLGSPDRAVYRYPTSGQPCDKNLCFTEGDADMVRNKFKNAPWTKDLRVCGNIDENKKDSEKPKTTSETKCMTDKQFHGVQTWGGQRYTGPLPSSGEPCNKSLCFMPGDAARVRHNYENAPWTKDLRICDKP
ncbi:hypothetical protein EC973_004148 [Apophysomyces ossiformis]|uniref:Uncharacterized protein n=1 Tax=Apophysomyces ossiformis TaxID=679940 RepID=A0A8H7BGF4_9FUNG|nr:hypothetical protein EC973_004148 [Apophysomyces ossiformis]